jgi:hypothetical protein
MNSHMPKSLFVLVQLVGSVLFPCSASRPQGLNYRMPGRQAVAVALDHSPPPRYEPRCLEATPLNGAIQLLRRLV